MYTRTFLFFLSFVTFTTLFSQNDDAILMSVNNQNVTVGEFKYIYEKNNGKEANYSSQSLNEYLDLYSKFKLKVTRAKDLKLDTIVSLQEELNGYKRQLANSYLTDKEILDHLLVELKERQMTDVRFKHILVSAPDNASDSIKNTAKQKIKIIKAEIDKGKTFEKAAAEYSDDKTSGPLGGDLGFFTAMLPEGFYELENTIYNLQPGKVSEPIRSRLGYHLIKVEEKRPAYGSISVAHILVKTGNAKDRINEAYNKLKEGKDFASVASQYSEDLQTSRSGGLLPVFGINTYDAIFENAAFALKQDGDISAPIETKSGWHIIKRIKKVSFSDDMAAFKKLNDQKIKKDERFGIARRKLVEDIKKSSGYTENRSAFSKFVSGLNEDFLGFKWAPEPSAMGMKEALITYGGNAEYSVGEFANFCKKNTKTRLKYEKNATVVKEVAENLLKEFSEEKAIDFEQKLLEIKYPDFKALMREYEEGILLFEATKRAVWDKANQDSLGLNAFFQKNNNKYRTEEKGNYLLYTIQTSDKKQAEKIMKFAKNKSGEEVLKKFNKKGVNIVSYIEETLEKDHPKFKDLGWEMNKQSFMKRDEATNSFTFSAIGKIFPERNKTLKEARGYVVADYQDHLEKEWLVELAKAYPIVIHQQVLKQMIKN